MQLTVLLIFAHKEKIFVGLLDREGLGEYSEGSGSQMGWFCSSGHLLISGDIFGCHHWGCTTGI